jgi:hypothetical protein
MVPEPAGPPPGGAVRRLARGARRLAGGLRRRPGTALAALLVLATVVAVGLARRDPVAPRVAGEVQRIGVVDGDDLPGYAAASRTELAALPGGEAYALAAFTGYEPPGRLPELLAGVTPLRVVARVPLPGAQTEIVRLAVQRLPDDVVAGMAQVAARKRAEAQRYRARSAASADPGGPGPAALADLAEREAAAYAAACPCAYAALVRGDRAALTALAGRPGVRVVDPAPGLRRPDAAVLTPPLPEQRDRARPPGGRASAAASGAGATPSASPR